MWSRRTIFSLLLLLWVSAFSLGWVRSFTQYDWCEFQSDSQRRFLVMSQGQLLGLQSSYGSIVPGQRSLDWGSGTHNGLVDLVADPQIDWQFHGGGCHWGKLSENSVTCRFYVVPYWVVVVPAAVIAIWLLLGKPHRTTKNMAHDRQNEFTTGTK